jgi:hypothetical protein
VAIERLSHATISITLGTYSHLQRLAEDAAERTGARLWPYDRGWVAHWRQGESPERPPHDRIVSLPAWMHQARVAESADAPDLGVRRHAQVILS